jgi:hypothetical protein
MDFEEIVSKLDFPSKENIKKYSPTSPEALKELINQADPTGDQKKRIVLGYLTTLCAEYLDPQPFILERTGIDYVGIELEKGTIVVKGDAGNNTGTTMKGGKITIEGNTGINTGKSMMGGEIIASEIESIGNTFSGRINAKKVHDIAPKQGAEIYIEGKIYRPGFLKGFKPWKR